MSESTGRLVAFVGAYGGDTGAGGITVLGVQPSDTRIELEVHSRTAQPGEAGYLVYSPSTRSLYAVDERKNDGRGPVGATASVHAFAVDPVDGGLSLRNALPAPAPFPTYIAVDEDGWLLTANHGGFDHVERVVRTSSGGFDVEYVYDDSAVLVYRLAADGSLDRLTDVHVTTGHGTDPNTSLQAGGHAQSASHAHSVVIDPSGHYVLVGDKGTDQIRVFRIGDILRPVFTFEAGPETGPRHLAFDPRTGHVYATYEFSSELVTLAFDDATGELRLLDRVPTTGGAVGRTNEPADVRVHPDGRLVYVNNRGEDTLAWFHADDDGTLTRWGAVRLADSIHPGLAARSFAFDPSGAFLLVADRPAGLVRAFTVDRTTGALHPAGEIAVGEPAFVTIVELP